MPKQSTGVPGLSWLFKYGETSGTTEIYTAKFKSTLGCARELFIFSSCILLCFCFTVSCHFLGYQFVLFRFQFTASNLLSAPGKRDNWASANCVQVIEQPSGLCGVCYIYLSFSAFILFLALPQIATTEGHASSEQVAYFSIMCRSRGTIISHSYMVVKPHLEYCLQLVKSNNYNARSSDTSW